MPDACRVPESSSILLGASRADALQSAKELRATAGTPSTDRADELQGATAMKATEEEWRKESIDGSLSDRKEKQQQPRRGIAPSMRHRQIIAMQLEHLKHSYAASQDFNRRPSYTSDRHPKALHARHAAQTWGAPLFLREDPRKAKLICQCRYHVSPFGRDEVELGYGPNRDWCKECDTSQNITTLQATGWI